MCVSLSGPSGSKLAEKCTTGSYGQPFVTSDGKNIVIPFKPVKNVKSIRVSFNDDFGQIQTFVVENE